MSKVLIAEETIPSLKDIEWSLKHYVDIGDLVELQNAYEKLTQARLAVGSTIKQEKENRK